MIADIAPHPCGGGAKVSPRNCRLRVFFLLENCWLMGEGEKFFSREKAERRHRSFLFLFPFSSIALAQEDFSFKKSGAV